MTTPTGPAKAAGDNKFKIREFQWFQMETRVRQMVQQLLTPFQKRVLEATNGLNSLKSFTTEQAIKLEQLRLLVTADPNNKEVDVFKKIDNKIEHNGLQILQLRHLMEQQNNLVDARFKVQEQRHRENNQILNLNMQLKQRVNMEILSQNGNITELRSQLQTMIIDLGAELAKLRKDHQEESQKLQDRNSSADNKIAQIHEWQQDVESRLKLIDQKHIAWHKKQIHLEEECIKLDKELESLHSNAAYTKKLANYVQDLEQKLRIQEHSIQNIVPLITQAQIGETLYNILPPKLKRRLTVQQHGRYSRLNQDVLENDYKSVQEKFRGLQLLQHVQKRNTRQVIDMKRKKLVSLGIDIDNITYEQREKYYKEVNLSEADLQGDDEQVKIKPGVDEAQIVRIIHQHINDYQKHLSQKVQINLEDSKRYLLGVEEDLANQLKDMAAKIDTTRQSLDTFQTDQLLQNRTFHDAFEALQKQTQAQRADLKKTDQNLFSFIQFCSLVNHLQIQDQLDKQSISLFGVRQTFNQTGGARGSTMAQQMQPRRIVDFNQNCFSCCGYPASTIAAFKMACLTYNPSEIVIEDRQYKREEILQISTKILQYIKNRLMASQHIQQNPDAGSNIHEEINKHKQHINIQSSNSRMITNPRINNSVNEGTGEKEKFSESKWRRTRRINTSGHHGKMVVMSRSSIKSASQHKDGASIANIFSQNKRKNIEYLT